MSAAALWQREERKARKLHYCDWCGQVILIGETYKRWAGLTDGDFGTLKAHADCWDAMDREEHEAGDWEGIDWGSRHLRGKTTSETCEEGP